MFLIVVTHFVNMQWQKETCLFELNSQSIMDFTIVVKTCGQVFDMAFVFITTRRERREYNRHDMSND